MKTRIAFVAIFLFTCAVVIGFQAASVEAKNGVPPVTSPVTSAVSPKPTPRPITAPITPKPRFS